MNKINILLTEANGNLLDKKEMIKTAVKTAEKYVFPKLKIDWDIDILVTNRIPMIILKMASAASLFRLILFVLLLTMKKLLRI